MAQEPSPSTAMRAIWTTGRPCRHSMCSPASRRRENRTSYPGGLLKMDMLRPSLSRLLVASTAREHENGHSLPTGRASCQQRAPAKTKGKTLMNRKNSFKPHRNLRRSKDGFKAARVWMRHSYHMLHAIPQPGHVRTSCRSKICCRVEEEERQAWPPPWLVRFSADRL